jgi:hypothetical protein
MKALEKVGNILNFLRHKLKRNRRSEAVFVEFSDFFISEKIFNLYGFHNLPCPLTNNDSGKRKMLFKVSTFSFVLFMILALMSLTIGLINNGTLLMLYENVCEIPIGFTIFVKIFLILYHYRKKLKEVVETLDFYYPQDGWNQYVFQVSRHLRTLKIHAVLTFASYTIACSCFCFMPYFVQFYGLVTSQKFELDSILHFYLPLIDQKHPVVYIAINLISLWSMFAGTVFMLMTDLLYIELVAIATMELNILGQLISEIDPEDDMESARKELQRLTNVHQELIDVTEKLNEIFSLILFIDLVGIIALMCLSAFMTFVSNGCS